jgi:hypothetical protein
MKEIYELGVNIIGISSITVAAIVACVYLLAIAIKYTQGDNLFWSDHDSISPLENRAWSTVVLAPLIIFMVGTAVALTWPVSLSLCLVFAILHLFRMRTLRKKKIWNTLKGD